MHQSPRATPSGDADACPIAPQIRQEWGRLSARCRDALSLLPHALLADEVRSELSWVSDVEIPANARLCGEDIEFIEDMIRDRTPEATDAVVALEPVGLSAWRVCDRAVPWDDAASLVAYVEHAGRRYQVVWVGGRMRTAFYECLNDIVADAAMIQRAGATRGATRPVQIPSRPPRSGLPGSRAEM